MEEFVEVKNPLVSFTALGVKANKGSKMSVFNLYTIMKQCESGSWKGKPKGFACILPYVSETFGPDKLTFGGTVFIDLDKFDEYNDLKGFQQVIFDNFEEITKYMPCLLAMKYSPSGNIHAFVYHQDIKDGNHYRELGALYLAYLTAVINKVTGVDLRQYEGVLDGHQMSPYQKFNVNDTPIKWNSNCVGQTFSRQDINKLKVEYAKIFKSGIVQRTAGIESTTLTGRGDVKADSDYVILGMKGYEARTAIAAASYYHFKQDVNKTRSWLETNFINADEINKQLTSMINNNRIANKYDSAVEQYLFGNDGVKTVLKDGEYLSQKIDFNQLNSKWYYIISNTNTGKTEFVKGLTKDSRKIIILQMNKALRDGKKQGIEDITMGNFNWGEIASKDQIHTTVEGFIRNCNGLDLQDYVIVVDEAHLLQDYSALDGKMKTNRELIEILPNAGKIIFMSATPKTEIKLFPFEVLEFEKIQNQILDIKCHPIKFTGRGSREATRYSYMFNYINKTSKDSGFKSVIFSNKHQECWKKYGIKDMEYTWFHSMNKEDSRVASILDDNKLLTDITLATIYLGVGVEIKHEEEIHIWFDLDEGWDRDFIIQSIGRPRDAKIIHVHFFYNSERDIKQGRLNEHEVEMIENAFGHLIELNDEYMPTVNLIAAKMTGVYDVNFNTYKCRDKIQALKIGQMISNKDYMSIYDIDLLKKLPYNKIQVRFFEEYEINTDGKTRIKRKETDLEEFLINATDEWWREHENKTYNELLDELDIITIDRKNGRTVIEKCKFIWRRGFKIKDAYNYFGSIDKAREIIGWLNNYCDVKSGLKSIAEFEGMNTDVADNIKGQFEMIEKIFTQDYLDYRIDKMLLKQPIREHVVKLDYDIIDLLGIDFGMPEGVSEAPKIELDSIEVFKGTDYKEISGKVKKERVTKMGESNKVAVKIQNIETGELFEFEKTKEAIEFLGTNKRAFSDWKNGKHVRALTNWKLIS